MVEPIKAKDPSFHAFEDQPMLEQALAHHIASKLRHASVMRGKASLAVSGGTTPKGVYRQLSQLALEWDKVTIALVDERWVSPEHAASNEATVRATLLQNEAQSASFIGLWHEAESIEEGVMLASEQFRNLPNRFDVVLLGMGNDGHTASLFPYTENLMQGLAPTSGQKLIAIQPLDASWPRISMTLPRILASDEVILLFVGDDKRQVFNKALAGDEVERMPVRAVLRQSKTPVEIFWAP